MEILCVRDFIYIDIDRVKSISSQLECGLTDEIQSSNGNSETTKVGGKGGLPFLSAEAGSEFQTNNQLLETKSLHDYIYNKVENILLNEDKLLRVSNADSYSSHTIRSIGNAAFILAKGKVVINDYNQLKKLLDNWEGLSKFIAKCHVSSKKENMTQSQAKLAYDNLLQDFIKNIDKDYRKGLSLFIDMFYQDRIVIKITPYSEYPDFRLVGNIDKKYLRDNIESIRYKYSTAPVSDWTIFCQIASMPLENRTDVISNMTNNQIGNGIENSFQKIFDSYRAVENMAQTVTYPEIAVTPIAIYRE
jgi:hypothetical protein